MNYVFIINYKCYFIDRNDVRYIFWIGFKLCCQTGRFSHSLPFTFVFDTAFNIRRAFKGF